MPVSRNEKDFEADATRMRNDGYDLPLTMQKRGRIAIRLIITTGILTLATALPVSTSAADTYCSGRITDLGTGGPGLTVHIDGCASECPGGLDSAPTDPGMTRMLAVLLSAQARGAAVAVLYTIPAARCVLGAAIGY
jgi:hypothetical protein